MRDEFAEHAEQTYFENNELVNEVKRLRAQVKDLEKYNTS